MKSRLVLARRLRLPALLSLSPALFGCEIEIARSTPHRDPVSENPFGSDDWRNAPGPELPDYTGSGSEPPEEEPQPWLEYRDLIAIDPALVQGPLASNAAGDAPLSFRSQMQWLAASTRDPLSFARSWFEQWLSVTSPGPDMASFPARPGAGPVLIDSWLGRSGGADAGADAGYLPRFTPSWADAPFVLIAIVNRVDLASGACEGFAGELRYVYAARDVESGEPLDMTVIIEIPYPTLRPAAEWARLWQGIGQLPPDDSYARAVADLAREVQAEADPLRARVRTNEIALGGEAAPSWEMREFQTQIIDSELALALVPLVSTPRADADPAALSAHVIEHSEEIMAGPVSLPLELQAGAAEIPTPDFSWAVLGVSERLRRAFSVETCNGCHGGDTQTLPFRHIAPGRTRSSRAQLSRFLYDPQAPRDELRRRSEALSTLTSIACAPPEPASPYTGL